MNNLPALAQVREQRDYSQHDFLNRQEELRLVSKRVEQGRSGRAIAQPLMNFWGVPGIGKSWFLRHLQHLYAFQPKPLTSGERPTFTLLFDFRDIADSSTLMTKLTSEMAKQIIAQLGLVLPEDSKNDLERVIALRPKQSAQAISLFTNTINVLSQTFVPILLLDSVELVSEAVRDEVETQIIEPVIWNDRVIIIVAGRRQIPRWKRFEVRRRVADAASTAIEPFDRTTVRTLLGKMGFMGLADEVYGLSYGHPQTTDLLGRTFKQAAERFSVDSAYLINRQRELGDFLRQVEEYVLEGTKEETRTNLELISVLRYFRVDPLRKFMIEFRGEQFDKESDAYYLKDVIGAMETTNLVWWSRQHRAYVISDVVRRIMNRRLALTKPDYYIRLHQKALDMYLRWIAEFPNNASEFIIETIFHSAMLAQITDSGKLGESIAKRLDDATKLSPEDANTLYEQFGTDKELEDLLSPEEHRRLLDEFANIRDHKNQTRQ